jgi:hypothetical protein
MSAHKSIQNQLQRYHYHCHYLHSQYNHLPALHRFCYRRSGGISGVVFVASVDKHVQLRRYMTTSHQLKTETGVIPHYPSRKYPNLNMQNYIVLYCNPNPSFLRNSCIATIIYAVTLLIASYNLVMTSLKKHKEKADREPVKFDTNAKISFLFSVVSVLVVSGFSYYAKKNVLELGLIKNQQGKITEARVVFGKLISKDGFREEIFAASSLSTPSLHMLKIDSVADPKAGIADPALIRKRRMFGDYMFLNIEGSKFNYLIDLTNQKAFFNRLEMDKFFRQNAQNKKVQFK